jgi:transposase
LNAPSPAVPAVAPPAAGAPPATTDPRTLGIDIAKRSFDAVVLLPDGKHRHRRFDNHPSGFQALLQWLQRLGVPQVRACMEATGPYWEALATFLHDQGQLVSAVNPKRISHFAKSRLARAKTDKIDAFLIALFAAQEQPALWRPPAPAYRQLRDLVRRREQLQQQRQQEQNRLEALEATPHALHAAVSLRAHLEYLAQAQQEVGKAIQEHFAAHPELRKERDLLVTIGGVGETTAGWFLAEVGDVKRFKNAREVAAYTGLDPRVQQSGAWKGKTRLSKQGNALLRKQLFFPALAALRCNPVVKQLAARLREGGKTGMAIVGAAMRKLVHLAYGVLRHGKAFDPAWGA